MYLMGAKILFLTNASGGINTFFQNQKTATTLENYCEKFGISVETIEKFLSKYEDLSNLKEGSNSIQQHNQVYLQEHLKRDKDYLDSVLTKVDPIIALDEEQRKVVLTDEDYMLVVAGAGAGKTTTVSAKVKYLVDKKKVNPEQILVISFTNKAANGLYISLSL